MASRSIRIGAAILGGCSLAGLSACANLASFSAGPLPVPPGSPVAQAVAEAQRNPGPIPKFSDIPPVPTDAPDSSVRLALQEQSNAAARELERAVAAFGPIDPEATQAFLQQTRAVFEGVEPPTEAERAATEAFVRAARARATPPPAPR